jgi:hypothetical protein
MSDTNPPTKPNNTKAINITLLVLVLFVIAVFTMTILKFIKAW